MGRKATGPKGGGWVAEALWAKGSSFREPFFIRYKNDGQVRVKVLLA